MQQGACIVRLMKEEDIPWVSEIDRKAFPSESLFRPYTSYKQEIHNSVAHYIVACTERNGEQASGQQNLKKRTWRRNPFHHRAVTPHEKPGAFRSERNIVGFAGLWILLDEAHITAIAVSEAYRRLGIGEGLLISIVELASRLNANMVTLEVRASNLVAQGLYAKYGFRVVGKRPRYYSDNGEDALLMSTDTLNSASFQSQFQRLKEIHSQNWELLLQLP